MTELSNKYGSQNSSQAQVSQPSECSLRLR